VATAAAALHEIERRMARACERSKRDPAEVVLIGASKLQPVEHLQSFYHAGLRIFGENRVQEAEEKRGLLPADVEWHLLGPLQSNKVQRAAASFAVFHALDRLKIGHLLSAAAARGRLRCFVEVNLGEESSKHGLRVAEVETAVAELVGLPGLELVGLMTIPPATADPRDARPFFRRLADLRDALHARWPDRFGQGLSMGMSADFEVAIEEGATHVRIGTALFGSR
jgi:hypothetical protein